MDQTRDETGDARGTVDPVVVGRQSAVSSQQSAGNGERRREVIHIPPEDVEILSGIKEAWLRRAFVMRRVRPLTGIISLPMSMVQPRDARCEV